MDKSLNKIKIPARTKIAVWWMRFLAKSMFSFAAIFVFLVVVTGSYSLPLSYRCDDMVMMCPSYQANFYLLQFPAAILIFLSVAIAVLAQRILGGKKLSWYFSLAVLPLIGFLYPRFILFDYGILSELSVYFNSFNLVYVDVSLYVSIISLLQYAGVILIYLPVILLIFDRKNYFAAIGKAETPAKQT